MSNVPLPEFGPELRRRPRLFAGVARVICGLLGAAATVLWSLLVFVVLGSRFSTDAAHDPHGYGLIFGTVMAVPVGLVAVLAVPPVFTRPHRARASSTALLVYVLGTMTLFAAWFTA